MGWWPMIDRGRELPPTGNSPLPRAYVFIASKKSLFVLLYFSLSSRNSIASTVPIGFRIRRSTQSSTAHCARPAALPYASGLGDIDRRERPLVGQFPVQNNLRVTGALELFEDDFIHPAAGIDQRRRDNRQRPASSILRAAPKNRFGRCSAFASTPPVNTCPTTAPPYYTPEPTG